MKIVQAETRRLLTVFVFALIVTACGSGSNTSTPLPEQENRPFEVGEIEIEKRLAAQSPNTFRIDVEGGRTPYQFSWTISDGQSANGSSPSFSFASPGDYDITVEVSDANNQSFRRDRQVTVYPAGNIKLKLIGFNDFHGQMSAIDGNDDKRGGATRLITSMAAAAQEARDGVFFLHGGDHVGASPANSALLKDEPAINMLNILQDDFCNLRSNLFACDVLGTAGNHEFDEGSDELLRLLDGGTHKEGPFLDDPWLGANYTTLSANVQRKSDGELLLPSHVVLKVGGVDIAFIGITLESTPRIVVPGVVDDLSFKSQIDSVREIVDELRSERIEAIVLIVHDGVSMSRYSGPTRQNSIPNNRFGQFVRELPNEIDVVIAGHSHGFTNAYVTTNGGAKILVTQALSRGLAFNDIQIEINPETGDVASKEAAFYFTALPKSSKLSGKLKVLNDKTLNLVAQATNFSSAITDAIVGEYQAISSQNSLGQFIANAHRYAMQADLGVTNRGGIRAELREGSVSWGDLFAIQPFENALILREYSASELERLLDRSDIWSTNLSRSSSGEYLIDGNSLQADKTYRVVGNQYLLDNTAYSSGDARQQGPKDIDALVEYIKNLPQPFSLNDQPGS